MKTEKICKKAGTKENCRLIVDPEGHRFYAEQSQPIFKKATIDNNLD